MADGQPLPKTPTFLCGVGLAGFVDPGPAPCARALELGASGRAPPPDRTVDPLPSERIYPREGGGYLFPRRQMKEKNLFFLYKGRTRKTQVFDSTNRADAALDACHRPLAEETVSILRSALPRPRASEGAPRRPWPLLSPRRRPRMFENNRSPSPPPPDRSRPAATAFPSRAHCRDRRRRGRRPQGTGPAPPPWTGACRSPRDSLTAPEARRVRSALRTGEKRGITGEREVPPAGCGQKHHLRFGADLK